MGAYDLPSGAGSASPQALARAAATWRKSLGRHLPVLWLRAQLFCDPKRWTARAGASANLALDRVGRAVETLSWHTVQAVVRAIEWRRVALVASAPFVLPSEFRAAMVRILAYLSAIAALSLIATEFFKEPRMAEMIEAPARPAWLEVDKPWPAFQLAIPGFGEGDTHYAIRRHVAGGGRKDILSFGELGRTQRFISFEIYRAGDETGDFGGAVDEVRALAAEHGRVSVMQTAMPIPSKFGRFQTFEFGIGPFSGYKCIGFVRNFDTPRLQIGGLSCNMNLLVDRSVISCALDRLTLMSAGSAPDIARLFAQAELKRSFCGQRDHLLYATPKRPGSDATHSVASKPRLRGRIAR
ncbi:MAG: hypothetical protein ACOY5F_08590 [Pseudomonadota bacterium]